MLVHTAKNETAHTFLHECMTTAAVVIFSVVKSKMRWLSHIVPLYSVIFRLNFVTNTESAKSTSQRLNGSYCHAYFISWLHSLRLQIGFFKAAVFIQVIV